MNSFMDQYRTSRGRIDINRMHADVVSGKVTPPRYGMMRSFDASQPFDVPTIAEMNSFMDQYRTSRGRIDINRMHADVVSGKVTPPHMNRLPGVEGASKSSGGRASSAAGSAMMQNFSQNGYGMMGSNY
jgi:hypothetical protein